MSPSFSGISGHHKPTVYIVVIQCQRTQSSWHQNNLLHLHFFSPFLLNLYCPSREIILVFSNRHTSCDKKKEYVTCTNVFIAESFYDVKYWIVKCSSENCWFLVCCFSSVIWNISQINVFKTNCKSKCQNEFLGKLFLKSGNASV